MVSGLTRLGRADRVVAGRVDVDDGRQQRGFCVRQRGRPPEAAGAESAKEAADVIHIRAGPEAAGTDGRPDALAGANGGGDAVAAGRSVVGGVQDVGNEVCVDGARGHVNGPRHVNPTDGPRRRRLRRHCGGRGGFPQTRLGRSHVRARGGVRGRAGARRQPGVGLVCGICPRQDDAPVVDVRIARHPGSP